jgi:phasin family protein
MSYNNPFADLFKNNFDFNQVFSTQRRNLEALSAANQAVVEGAQAISRRQAEVFRANVENVLKVSKEVMTSAGTPEVGVGRQADLARALFENTLSNLREVTETVTKSGFEAFDVLNKRVAESLEEVGQATAASTTSNRKKSA